MSRENFKEKKKIFRSNKRDVRNFKKKKKRERRKRQATAIPLRSKNA
jgi:hypothetical protein